MRLGYFRPFPETFEPLVDWLLIACLRKRLFKGNEVLKCHWDQNFGIPYFYIFEHSLWFLVTMPNFNLLRRLEVAFFGRFHAGPVGAAKVHFTARWHPLLGQRSF